MVVPTHRSKRCRNIPAQATCYYRLGSLNAGRRESCVETRELVKKILNN